MKVLAIGDLHFPFENLKKLKDVIKIVKKEKPDVIVQLGDLYDFYMFSKFSKTYDFIKPENELKLARKKAIKFWQDVQKASPKSKCYQLKGNHDVRVLKKTIERYPEIYSLIKNSVDNLFNFKKVIVAESDRDYFEFDKVVYCHGWNCQDYSHARHFGKNVVRAHSHKAELNYVLNEKTEWKPMFELQCGALLDFDSVPAGYPASKHTNWKPALAIIINGNPMLEIL